MSSLWTPGGEVPVSREQPGAGGGPEPAPPGPGPAGPDADDRLEGDDAELRARIAEMQQRMLQAPAADIIAEHAIGLYELAALHLSQPEPRLADARVAIDALGALLEGLEGRLGRAEEQLRQVLPQLRMAFVEISDQHSSGSETS